MIIQSKRVWIANQFIPAQIKVDQGIIVDIYDYNRYKPTIDYNNYRLVPGFIDIHCHGAYGFDTNYANRDGLINWIKKIPSEGVTGFLPTTITNSEEVLSKALNNVSNVYKENIKGAQILGVHFEGPFLDTTYKGAQPIQYIIKPDIDMFERLNKISNNLIKIVTLAPEHDEDFKFTHYLREHNIVPSIGHSSANYHQVLMAIAAGAKSMTHIYNGMSAFNHRENNLIGAALRVEGIFGEVICDGNHSSFESLNMLYRLKGKDEIIMITDALMCKGSKVGSTFDFGGNTIEIVSNGTAYIKDLDTLAGSTLKMNEGLRNLVEKAYIPFDHALRSCTINPAKLLNIDNYKGKLHVGYDADIVVLDDQYNVIQTYCKGYESL